MLHVNDLSFRHGERVLFDRASAAISDGWKVGLVGRNGAGKSTLLRLIQGMIEADGGNINMTGRMRVGSVPQDPPGGDITVLDAVLAADVERTALLAEDETCHDGLRLAEIHARLDEIGAASAPSRAASILHGLGFDNEAQGRPCGEFSGGWRMRVALAGTLFSNPDLLILDEPSNHLDLEAMLWLTEHLRRFRHTLLMVSHDRDLLNDVCDHIVHIDQQKLVTYNGNYDRFERTRAERLEHDAAQQAKIAAQRKHMQAFVDRFKAKASKARQAQSRIKMIEKLGPIATVPVDERISFNFPAPEHLRLADRDDRRGHGRLRRRPAGAAQARPAPRHGRPHRAARPERQRQVDLHPAAVGPPEAARRPDQEDVEAARRLLLAGPGRGPRLRGHAVPPHGERARANARARPRCAPSSAASAFRATVPTSRSACCRAARRRGCCCRWPRATPLTCCCSTSRPTTSTWMRAPRWSTPSTTSTAPSCW